MNRNNPETYKDEHKHEKFVSNKHFIHEVEIYNPLSIRYKKYWREMKRRCMEGYWHEGKWMPGNLYFYINFCKIELSATASSKSRILAKPFLRDIEWEKSYVFAEARGFSGFEKDDEYTCYHEFDKVLELAKKEGVPVRTGDLTIFKNYELPASVFKANGKLKKYKPVREYLRTIHSRNLGKPIYDSNAWNVIDFECRRIGKDIFEDHSVITETGKKMLKDISIGDRIYGNDGKLTTVISKKRFTDQLQYKVTLIDGRSVECGAGHLWTVYEGWGDRVKTKTLELKELYKDYVKIRKDGKKEFKYRLPLNSPLEFDNDNPDIDPYFFGLWLGDGHSHTSAITTMDDDIVDFIYAYAEKLKLNVLKRGKLNNKASTYYITDGVRGNKLGTLNTKLRNLGVLRNKHIPESILKASVEYRISVLNGIIDSDGYCNQPGSYEVCTSYEQIRDTLSILLRELGIKFTIRVKKTKCRDSYRFKILSDLPKPMSRKDKGFSKSMFANRQRDRVAIADIQPTVVKPSICIGVDNKDSLFLVEDYIVTHNSFFAGDAMIAHNFLMDGSHDYDEYWKALQNNSPMKSTTLVGAIDSFYSKTLLDKTLSCLSNLVGSQTFQGKFVPSPLNKAFSGSFNSGTQTISSLVDKKVGGNWKKIGTDSKIIHKTFRDNPLAGNGAAAGLACFEEVGFFDNLGDTLNAIKDTTYNGTKKFGTIYMFGTGGEGDSGKIDQAKDVFYDPSAYDCLCFDDIWEESGSIGFFVPYEMGLNQFKDEEGNTDLKNARLFIENKREKAKKSKKNGAYLGEIQNNPQVPSEVFLVESSDIFPTIELKDQLRWVNARQDDSKIKGMYGTLAWDVVEGRELGVKFIPDTTGVMRPCGFKMKQEDDKTGCVHIWELPVKVDGSVPHNLYIAGQDPYDQDQSTTSSLGSTIIYKTFYVDDGIQHAPVAEYTARPERIHDHHENVRKLLTLYNAKVLYENERNSFKMHLEHRGSLHLLAKTPEILKANEGTKVNRTYGQHMTEQVKKEIEIYTRNWLLEDAGNGMLNLNKIYSIPLLEELIAYNRTGNFDRVIAFMLTILHKLVNFHRRAEVPKKADDIDPFFKRGNKGKFF